MEKCMELSKEPRDTENERDQYVEEFDRASLELKALQGTAVDRLLSLDHRRLELKELQRKLTFAHDENARLMNENARLMLKIQKLERER